MSVIKLRRKNKTGKKNANTLAYYRDIVMLKFNIRRRKKNYSYLAGFVEILFSIDVSRRMTKVPSVHLNGIKTT